ncbi:hypothetical protein [Kineococcus sp. SYSU DK002]|uniref:hypothetical protein n=1 Tax=Kineococcus sp. SYSU DK002 TaxID=3383123 RepID=UPI003D7D8C42
MTQRELLERWWSTLDAPVRRDVLRVRPGDFLDEAVARDLQRSGVHVPGVALAVDVAGDVRRGVVHVQPRELTDFLVAVR